MKLKTRLIITFFVIACVPLAMAAIALFGFSQIQIRPWRRSLELQM